MINKNIAKKIHEIRCALGYATKMQREKGWEDELKSMNYLIKDAKKYGVVGSGGFTYTKLKSGNIKITPDFSFIIRTPKKVK